MKTFDILVAGCGSVGLPLLKEILQKNLTSSCKIVALEASSRIGGNSFFASRVNSCSKKDSPYLAALPPLKIWWDRTWIDPKEVEWSSKEWAFVLPQWETYFSPCAISPPSLTTTLDFNDEIQKHFQSETPISEVKFENNLWTLCSGEKTYCAPKLYWTLGLKNFQNCFGKKQAEEFLVKNPSFMEGAREAEGVLAAEYSFPKPEHEITESFVAIPVRFESKLYLSFVFLNSQKVESFTYLQNDLLKSPKELSSFEKALKRSLKHVFATSISELENPSLGVINEAQGHEKAQPWTLKDCPEKGIFFVSEKERSLKNESDKETSLSL